MKWPPLKILSAWFYWWSWSGSNRRPLECHSFKRQYYRLATGNGLGITHWFSLFSEIPYFLIFSFFFCPLNYIPLQFRYIPEESDTSLKVKISVFPWAYRKTVMLGRCPLYDYQCVKNGRAWKFKLSSSNKHMWDLTWNAVSTALINTIKLHWEVIISGWKCD